MKSRHGSNIKNRSRLFPSFMVLPSLCQHIFLNVYECFVAGYKTVQVIKGEADAYVHVTAIKKWDICAGNAIILSVEGTMTTLDGFYVNYAESNNVVNDKGLLATTHDHPKFLSSLQPAFEESKEKKKQKSTVVKRKRSTTLSTLSDTNDKKENKVNVVGSDPKQQTSSIKS